MRRTGLVLALVLVGLAAGAGCSGDGSGDEPPSPLRLFTTRQMYERDLGGLAGADAKCQTAADSLVLGGTWQAWLSTTTSNAIDRVTADEPYFQVNQSTRIFNNKVNWTTLPLSALDRSEDGEILDCLTSTNCFVWTGTVLGGTAAPDGTGSTIACDWHGTEIPACKVGFAGATDSQWTDAGSSNPAVARLYCFELREE